jgi:hypothetical protein
MPPDSRCLADIAKSKWSKAYVYAFCETSLDDMAHGQARVIGQVQFPSEECPDNAEGEPDKGSVLLFYQSNVDCSQIS